jgi:hypothetical protein
MPVIEQIPTNKTQFWQLGTIPENKGTINGIYSIHQNIFLEQFGLSALDDPLSQEYNDFKKQLWLVYSNQLTAYHIQSIKSEQVQAQRPYDRRD